jgi:hypothetical protein
VSQGGSGAGEAFSTLDAEGAKRVTWVHAGAQQAEAGFEDPHLGWVSVRADVSGAGIHAALVPASTDAAQVMSGHLEGLNAYVSEHHSAVGTITLAAPSGSAHDLSENGSPGRGMQQGAEQGSGQGAGRENGQESGSGYSANRKSNGDSGEGGVSASSAAQSAQQDTLMQRNSSGGRISLMA